MSPSSVQQQLKKLEMQLLSNNQGIGDANDCGKLAVTFCYGILNQNEEEESDICGNGCGSEFLKRVYDLSDTYGIFIGENGL